MLGNTLLICLILSNERFSGLSNFWNQNPKGKKPLAIKKKDERLNNCRNQGEDAAG